MQSELSQPAREDSPLPVLACILAQMRRWRADSKSVCFFSITTFYFELYGESGVTLSSMARERHRPISFARPPNALLQGQSIVVLKYLSIYRRVVSYSSRRTIQTLAKSKQSNSSSRLVIRSLSTHASPCIACLASLFIANLSSPNQSPLHRPVKRLRLGVASSRVLVAR